MAKTEPSLWFSECLTGDVFGSARCDCGPQLREAVEQIEAADEATPALGFPEDARDYTAAAQMLDTLGITRVDVLSNNPDNADQLRGLGLTVRRTAATGVFATDSNLRYLHGKAEHTQHTIMLPAGLGSAFLAG